MSPPTKLQVCANFWPQKMLQHPFSPGLSPPEYFLFPKLKIKLKLLNFWDVAGIQEAVTDELKQVLKEKFSAALYASVAYFEFKKVNFFMCLRFLKNQS
jgi:hypothetical protein